MRKLESQDGKVFGKLTVIKRAENKGVFAQFLVQCSCGSPEKIVAWGSLRDGNTTSCCCTRSLSKMYGLPTAKIHNVWRNMIARCYDSENISYSRYGALGRTVEEAWKEESNFLHWCGKSGYKEGLTLERVDNNKGYSASNCTWITREEQSKNMRSTIWVTYKKKEYCLAEFCRICKLPYARELSKYHKLGRKEYEKLYQ